MSLPASAPTARTARTDWIRVATWTELTQALSASRRGLVRVGGQKPHRVLLESGGSLFVYGYMRRIYGSRLASWPTEWDGSAVGVKPLATRSQGERLARSVRLWAGYILRHTKPDVWPDMREQAEVVTPDRLQAFAEAVDQGADPREALKRLGMPTEPGACSYRTTTLRSEGAPYDMRQLAREAFAERKEFRVCWSAKYDCTARGKPCPDGAYRGWLRTERRGMAHGHRIRLTAMNRGRSRQPGGGFQRAAPDGRLHSTSLARQRTARPAPSAAVPAAERHGDATTAPITSGFWAVIKSRSNHSTSLLRSWNGWKGPPETSLTDLGVGAPLPVPPAQPHYGFS